MKKFLWIAFLSFCFSGVAAESDWNADSVQVYFSRSVTPVIQKNWKDHKLILKTYRQFLKTCESVPDSVLKQCSWCFIDTYYNVACCESLMKRKKAAVDAFEKAIQYGYYDYAHAQKDTDLDNVRDDKRFQKAMERLREVGDFGYILRKSPGYDDAASTDSLSAFTYMNPNDRDLVRVRRYFNLDSIAGSGDELSKIRNLMHWVHNAVRHDGSSRNPTSRNAIDLIEVCRKENRGINCRMMAQVLNECYLAMGFKSRFVTCMPRKMVNDCHVINVVYSATLDKWVWVDPTFDAYVVDENGVMLSIQEVRERMRDGRPYFLNEDANWNNESPQTQKHYLDTYMAKNLYYLVCSDRSEFDTETWCEGKHPIYYVALIPEGYDCDREYHFMTTNDKWFWASPYAE